MGDGRNIYITQDTVLYTNLTTVSRHRNTYQYCFSECFGWDKGVLYLKSVLSLFFYVHLYPSLLLFSFFSVYILLSSSLILHLFSSLFISFVFISSFLSYSSAFLSDSASILFLLYLLCLPLFLPFLFICLPF